MARPARASTTLSDSLSTTSAPRQVGPVPVSSGWTERASCGPREDVDRAVVVAPEQRAVGGRGLGQLVDLVAQRGDVLAASRRVKVSLSFCEMACWSWPLVSRSFSSRVLTRFGTSCIRRRRPWTSSSRTLAWSQIGHLLLIGGDAGPRRRRRSLWAPHYAPPFGVSRG